MRPSTDPDAERVLDELAGALRAVGTPVGRLQLVPPVQATGRSTLYLVGEDGDRPAYVVKVPVLGRTPVDTDPALPSSAQYGALTRAHGWFEQEDRHSVARPVALLAESDGLAMEFVRGTPLPRAITRALVARGTARRAVIAAGDALRRAHRHGGEPHGEIDLGDLVDDIRAVETSALRPAGIRLPDRIADVLAAVPSIQVPARRVLLHGDYVPSNLILTDPDQVAMIDPVLARAGLPEDDLARFLAILSSDSVFVPGLAVPPVRRLRESLEDAFRTAYGPGATGAVAELRLVRQHVLRWRRRRDHSRLAEGSALMRARRRLIDAHMVGLLGEAAERLRRHLDGQA